MKYIKQILIIAAISFTGELLSLLIPLPVPAGIYGLIILFIGLETKIIPYENVKETGHLLVEIMSLFFIPSAVGLIDSWNLIKNSIIQYIVIMFVSTVAVMIISGKVTQFFLHRGRKDK